MRRIISKRSSDTTTNRDIFALRSVGRDDPALAEWLADYSGLGDLRSANYMDLVMKKAEK